MDFCRGSFDPPAGLAAVHGVYAGATLAAVSDARVVAQGIVDEARAQARMLADEEMARSRAEIGAREQDHLERALALLAELERLPRAFLAQAEPLVVELAQALFLRLAGALAPAEQVAALLRQVRAAAPPRLPDPVLHLHPEDAALLAPEVLPGGWTLRADPALAPRQCRLESAAGTWEVGFDAAVRALCAALPASASV